MYNLLKNKYKSYVNRLNIYNKYILITLFVSLLYIVFGKIGLTLAIPPGSASSVFPAAGLAVGLLLFNDYWKRCSLGIFLGSFLVNMWVFHSNSPDGPLGLKIVASSTIGIGSLLQAIVISSLIKKLIGATFSKLFDVFKFICITMLSCLIASSIGVSSLYFNHFLNSDTYLYNWITWLLGDAVGILLITPLFMTYKHSIFKNITIDKLLEFLLLLMTIFLFTSLIFSFEKNVSYTLLFSIYPILVWSALRFEQFEVSLSFCLIAIIAIINTAKGIGALVTPEYNVAFLTLQYFIAIAGMIKLTISVCIYELKQSRIKVENSRQELEILVSKRTQELEEINIRLQGIIANQEKDKKQIEINNLETEKLRLLTKELNK